jgi:hypothetical protein
LLEQTTEQGAIDFVRRIKHASGQNYIIGGPAQVHSIECSAGKVSRFNPDGRSEKVWHTNHPLVNDDFSPSHRALRKKTRKPHPGAGNSVARMQALEKRLRNRPGLFGLDQIRETLGSRDSAENPVCRPFRDQQTGFTFAATIMVLGDPEFHVAPGPPNVTAYQTYSFRSS